MWQPTEHIEYLCTEAGAHGHLIKEVLYHEKWTPLFENFAAKEESSTMKNPQTLLQPRLSSQNLKSPTCTRSPWEKPNWNWETTLISLRSDLQKRERKENQSMRSYLLIFLRLCCLFPPVFPRYFSVISVFRSLNVVRVLERPNRVSYQP